MTTEKRLEALKGFRATIIWVRRLETSDQKGKDEVLRFLTTQAARETPVDPYAEKMIKANKYYFPECDEQVINRAKYCSGCGQKLSWKILKGGE